jgi:pimeloyl-ACP methyl ester carboxylesterase
MNAQRHGGATSIKPTIESHDTHAKEGRIMDIVLVHGAYHGAWCWERLAPELVARGHVVTAVDLPISDAAAGTAAYADAVVEAIDAAGATAPAVVGHSMGGLVIPIVAARLPVTRLIFLAAFLPEPGRTLTEQRASEPIDGPVPPATAEWTDVGDNLWLVGPNTATELFFHDADPDLAAWAVARLRPQSYAFMGEPSPLIAWPEVPSRYIVCRDDRTLNPDWAREAARRRLGVEAVEIDGGHSPFLTRPAELAAIIDTLIAG